VAERLVVRLARKIAEHLGFAETLVHHSKPNLPLNPNVPGK
jgi:hypothetical protein